MKANELYREAEFHIINRKSKGSSDLPSASKGCAVWRPVYVVWRYPLVTPNGSSWSNLKSFRRLRHTERPPWVTGSQLDPARARGKLGPGLILASLKPGMNSRGDQKHHAHRSQRSSDQTTWNMRWNMLGHAKPNSWNAHERPLALVSSQSLG